MSGDTDTIREALYVLDHGRADQQLSIGLEAVDRLEAQRDELARALARACYLADHLLVMVPREVWRDSGDDDGQGHYEGDHHAEKVAAEILELTALAAAEDAQ